MKLKQVAGSDHRTRTIDRPFKKHANQATRRHIVILRFQLQVRTTTVLT